jgi:hypothetical protein
MLEATIRRYQNRTIEAAQVIAELIELAKQMREGHTCSAAVPAAGSSTVSVRVHRWRRDAAATRSRGRLRYLAGRRSTENSEEPCGIV